MQADLIAALKSFVDIKILGVSDQLLGITLSWGESFCWVHLSVGKSIRKLMQLCNIDGSDDVKVPIDPSVKLKRSDCPTQEQIEANPGTHKDRTLYYQKIMGGCIFVNNVARPDISYAMNVLTRHMHNPSQKHLDVALDLVRYLACTEDLGIVYSRLGNRRPILYCDADKGSQEHHQPTNGHILFLANGPVVWKCTNSDMYALSTCESEIRAVDASQPAIETAMYVKHILEEVLDQLPQIDIQTDEIPLNFSDSVDYNHLYEPNLLDKHEPLTQAEKDTLLIMEDNKATIDWTKKAGAGSKMRHLETKLLWIKKAVATKVIKLQHVPTKEQIADIFTKALAPAVFIYLISQFMYYVHN
jgi:histone deacetylase 1/2